MLARPVPQPDTGLDGIIDLPAGKIAAIATFLEMRAPPPSPSPGLPAGSRLERIVRDLARYRALYAAVGEPWLWFSRSGMPDGRLRGIIADPAVEAMAFMQGERDIGIVELDFRRAGCCEVSFFGLVPDATGRGLGHVLMDEAIRRAFARPIERLWLHTCTLDHPSALAFYMKAGFTPYRRAIEIADDPRLTGRLSREAGPGTPML